MREVTDMALSAPNFVRVISIEPLRRELAAESREVSGSREIGYKFRIDHGEE